MLIGNILFILLIMKPIWVKSIMSVPVMRLDEQRTEQYRLSGMRVAAAVQKLYLLQVKRLAKKQTEQGLS